MCFKETKIPKGLSGSNGTLRPQRTLQEHCQIGRPFRPEIQRFTRHGVLELEPSGVQRLPRGQAFQSLGGNPLGAGHPPAATRPVNRVSDDRVTDMGQVHPDLVGAPGVQFEAKQVDQREPSHHESVGA